jgi:hypothetical protein
MKNKYYIPVWGYYLIVKDTLKDNSLGTESFIFGLVIFIAAFYQSIILSLIITLALKIIQIL